MSKSRWMSNQKLPMRYSWRDMNKRCKTHSNTIMQLVYFLSIRMICTSSFSVPYRCGCHRDSTWFLWFLHLFPKELSEHERPSRSGMFLSKRKRRCTWVLDFLLAYWKVLLSSIHDKQMLNNLFSTSHDLISTTATTIDRYEDFALREWRIDYITSFQEPSSGGFAFASHGPYWAYGVALCGRPHRARFCRRSNEWSCCSPGASEPRTGRSKMSKAEKKQIRRIDGFIDGFHMVYS